MLLALDTSTSFASIALVSDERLLASFDWYVGQRHSTELFTRLTWLLDSCGVAPDALERIAVATGPGSFNGLRVALATAKALAFALHRPLYAVPTLDVFAWGAAFAGQPVWALLEAGRGQLYAAAYPTPCTTPATWKPLDGYHVLTPVEVAARVSEPVLFCGEWRDDTKITLERLLGARARFAPSLTSGRAARLATLAQGRVAAGLASDDPAALEPLYIRRPAITASAKAPIRLGDHAQRHQTNGGEEATHALHH